MTLNLEKTPPPTPSGHRYRHQVRLLKKAPEIMAIVKMLMIKMQDAAVEPAICTRASMIRITKKNEYANQTPYFLRKSGG